MEPTTQPIESVIPKKNHTLVYIILSLMIVIGVITLIVTKTHKLAEAPVVKKINDVLITSDQSKTITAEINNATTFDNENDLKQIDKEF